MSIAHEENARKVHPSANDFQPVYRGMPGLTRRLIGWVFKVQEEGKTFESWSWITTSGDVSSDPKAGRHSAEKTLVAYVSYHRISGSGRGPNTSGTRSVAADSITGSVMTGDGLRKEN